MKQLRRPNVKKGSLIPLGNDFLLAVGTHPNKVDDIDIGPNNKNGLSVNHGEILQVTKDNNNYSNGGSAETVRVFSAEPMFKGISPAQLLYRGMPADKVFAMQEQYKRIHRLNSDGTHYDEGGESKKSIIQKIIDKFISPLKKDKSTSIDWSGIVTTGNRAYNQSYIDYINKGLVKKGVGKNQRAAILANIIEESGGDPFAVDSTKQFKGLLQWEQSRYWPGKETNVYKELDNQINYIYDTLSNTTDKKSWTHGGKGSGYNSLTDAITAFNSENDLDAAMKGYTLGYVRPTGKLDSYNNRLKVAKQIIEKEGFKNGGIHIAPSKRGTFTAAANKHGMSVQDFASKVLANKDNYSPAMVKKANFARNASKWKHLYGGEDTLINPLGERPNVNLTENMKNKRTKNDYGGNNNTPYTLVTTSTGYNSNPILIRTPIDFREAMHKASLNAIRARMQKEGIDDYIQKNLQTEGMNISSKNISDIYPNKRIKNYYGNELQYIENQLPIGAGINLDNPFKFDFTPTTIGGKITQYNNFLNNAKKSSLYNPFSIGTSSTTSGAETAAGASKVADASKGIGLPAWGADLINAGINVIGSGINWGLRNKYADSLKYNPLTYTLLAPKKLKTKINIAPQLAQMRENAAKYEDAINRNTASSRTALNRIGNIRNQTLLSSMDLYGKKENAETELINKDLLNQQNIANQNAQNIQNIVNQNIKGYTDIENQRAGIKAQNNVDFTNNLASAVSMPLNRYIGRQSAAANMATIMLANPEAAKLIGGDKWKQAYNQVMGLIG